MIRMRTVAHKARALNSGLPKPLDGRMSELLVPVSYGELLDKIAILQI